MTAHFDRFEVREPSPKIGYNFNITQYLLLAIGIVKGNSWLSGKPFLMNEKPQRLRRAGALQMQ
jgi:hypothetical protein